MGNVQTHGGSYKGRKYEPSQQQVDAMTDEMERACRDVVEKCRDKWHGVDMGMLLQKVRSKLQKEHPSLFFLLPAEGGHGVRSKRRKVQGGPVIIPSDMRITFQVRQDRRVTFQVLTHIIPYCDRSTINNLSLTCMGACQTIRNKHLVPMALPWPSRCPWPAKRGLWSHVVHGTVASGNLSRFAVFRRKIKYDDEDDDSEYSEVNPDYDDNICLEIWDRYNGLIGELSWYEELSHRSLPLIHVPLIHDSFTESVFSPDGQLLLVPLAKREKDGYEGWESSEGIRAVQLPPSSGYGRAPIIATEHRLGGGDFSFENVGRINSVAFVDNDTIAVAWRRDAANFGIDLYKINLTDGNISISFAHRILEDLELETSMLASLVSGTKTFLAIKLAVENRSIIIYDLTTGVSVRKNLPAVSEGSTPPIVDLSFTASGKLVVLRYGNNTIHNQEGLVYAEYGRMNILDCDVNTVEEIGNPRDVFFDDPDMPIYRSIICSSVESTKAIAKSDPYDFIDLERGEILSKLCRKEDGESDHSAWNAFVNYWNSA